MINRAFGGGRIFRALGERPLPEWAAGFDCTSWAQLLLKYALSHPAATVAIPGMTKAHHVEDNLMAGHGRLPDAAERNQIEAFFDDI
jgi:aryl-alcohol dehydrogenase-like predicted oxidoreductase